MRSLTFITVLALAGCAVTPPKPSIWQIESECAESQSISRIEECTRDGLDAQYADAWHSTPAADQFLDFIGSTAARVESGDMSDADGRLAISTYASQAVAVIQGDEQAQQAERNAQLQGALNALSQMGRPPTVEAPAVAPGQMEVFLSRDLGTHGLFHVCQYSDGKLYSFNATELCPMQVAGSAMPEGGTGFKVGEYLDGMTKVCVYNVLGTNEAVRIEAAQLCPLSYNF